MENNFEIVLTAVDNATENISKVKTELNGVAQTTNEVSKVSTTAGKNIQTQFKEASKEAREFRKSLFIVTAAFAGMVAATREAAKYSDEAKVSYDDFTTSMRTLSVTLGQMFAPALEGVSFIVKVLTDTIEAAVAGFIKLGTFIVAFFENIRSGPVEAYKTAMETANMAADNFLNKIEETRIKVQQGLTLDKEGVKQLEAITIHANEKQVDSWGAVKDSIFELGSAFSAAAELGRAWGYAAAAVAIGLATINTAVGVTKAFATYPYPFSIVIAGIIAAAGAIQIATIAATKFHEGGLIKAHSGLAVDEVPIIAQTGEGILSRTGMSALGGAGMLNRLNSGGGSGTYIHIEINNPQVRSDEDIDKLAEEVSQRIARETERL